MQKKNFVIGILAVFFSLSSSAFAYETMEVKNGGSIEGTVEFAGANVPIDQVVKVIPDENVLRRTPFLRKGT